MDRIIWKYKNKTSNVKNTWETISKWKIKQSKHLLEKTFIEGRKTLNAQNRHLVLPVDDHHCQQKKKHDTGALANYILNMIWKIANIKHGTAASLPTSQAKICRYYFFLQYSYILLRNVGIYLQVHKASQPRRPIWISPHRKNFKSHINILFFLSGNPLEILV